MNFLMNSGTRDCGYSAWTSIKRVAGICIYDMQGISCLAPDGTRDLRLAHKKKCKVDEIKLARF
jgi:hypothetical protein